MAAPPTIPPSLQASPPASAGSVQLPDWLKFSFALLIVGGAAQALYAINPTASYLFVLLVIFGFAAVGSNLQNVNAFLKSIQSIGK